MYLESFGVDLATTNANHTVVAGGVVHTKGAWVEVISSTPHDIEMLQITNLQNDNYDFLVDIGIGPAASEIPIVENIYFAYRNETVNWSNPLTHCSYLRIPKGSRISLRQQATTASGAASYILHARYSTNSLSPSYGICDTYGADTSTTSGVIVPTGSPGAWTEMTASCTRDVKAVVVCGTYLSINYRVAKLQVGMGSAGNEVPVTDYITVVAGWNTQDTHQFAAVCPIPAYIPKGERIVVRQYSIDGSENLGAVLYCYS